MIWAVLIAFVASLAVGPILLPVLRKLKFGQNVFELAPETHKKKQGTPTMGGWMICIVGVCVAVVMHIGGWLPRTDMMLAALLLAVGNLFIGFADDMAKIRRKNNKGLSETQKLIFQTILALAFAYYCYAHPQIGSRIIVPFWQVEWDLGWFYIPAAAFVIICTTNGANLLDGLDGLLGSVSMLDFATFGLIALFAANAAPGEAQTNLLNVGILCFALAGACMGFLRFNIFPARMIMGDTGSMLIGGAMVAIALMLRLPLLIILICFCMLISLLSVFMQRMYFKATHGKRIFKMSPLHHHFELSGVPETKIVAMYAIVTALLCLLSLLSVSK